MPDYYQIILQLISSAFVPDDNGTPAVLTSTQLVLDMVCGIVPSHPIDQHDIYAAMEELGFQKILHELKNEDGSIKGYVYYWRMWRKE